MRHHYTEDQITWLSAHSNTRRAHLTGLFNEQFTASVSEHSIYRVMSKHGFLSDTPNPLVTRAKPPNYRGPGAEKLHSDGYMRVCDESGKWVLKHVHDWVRLNGPIPKKHRLACKSGDRSDCDPSNWELMRHEACTHLFFRSVVPYSSCDGETRQALRSIAKIKHAIRSKQ